MSKCIHCIEVLITKGVNTSKKSNKLYRVCFNPTTVVVKTGGVLLQDCPYNEGYEYECPFNKEVN